ncbi:phosphatase PAP2 family protein [Actinocorallia sp. A-T 12471]|uniref:phosphatase PAP2 family protein n=1 Tax=Actinocorallia sp. A-T 12471 TaxID=3089813 RepID=UPI0029CF0F3F|nr:phosphatase PAP2 family protein [Actinocorallia sp. A-T 12471]MDX6743915.1 phosphatase PAP2 family protein [Actinocorallia sp. A-T 12471]
MGTWYGRDVTRRMWGAVAALVAGAGLVAVLTPRGSGSPLRVEDGWSASLFRSAVEMVAGWPSWAAPVMEVATDAALITLVVAYTVVSFVTLVRRDVVGLAGLSLVVVGSTVAYGLSEVLKVAVAEERPCRAVVAEVAAHCPEVGDWSFPSNHSVIAMAIATGLAMLRPRLAWLWLPLGVLGVVLRVLVGVHYPHDVLAGAVWGAAGVAATLLVFAGPLGHVFTFVLTPLSFFAPRPGRHARRAQAADPRWSQETRVDLPVFRDDASPR